jgi:hypothetical protein
VIIQVTADRDSQCLLCFLLMSAPVNGLLFCVAAVAPAAGSVACVHWHASTSWQVPQLLLLQTV